MLISRDGQVLLPALQIFFVMEQMGVRLVWPQYSPQSRGVRIDAIAFTLTHPNPEVKSPWKISSTSSGARIPNWILCI